MRGPVVNADRPGAMNTSFSVGDLEIHRIVEQVYPFQSALDMLPGLTPERLAENRHWLEPASLDAEGRLVLTFQSYVVRTPHHIVLVDSCIGNDKHRPTRPQWHQKADETYLTGLSALGLSVDDIDYVLCTHLHADHVGWNTRLDNGRWVPTFPKARYVFGAREYAHWQGEHVKAPVFAFGDSVLPVVEAGRAEVVADDHALGDHVRLLPTPGHTPGHVAVAFGKGADMAVMSGDLMHSPLQARFPELSARFDTDPAQSAATRRSFLERYCDTRTICCTAHFPEPSSGRITRWGDGFRCTPVAIG